MVKCLKCLVIGAFVQVLVCLTGCVDKYDANVNEWYTAGLAISGDIISDSTVVFTFSKTLPTVWTKEYEYLFSEDFMNVDVEMSVRGSDGTSWQGEQVSMGKYQVEIGTLQPDVEYYVEAFYDGETYQSVPQKPLEASGIGEIKFLQEDEEEPMTIQLSTLDDGIGEPKYFLWHLQKTWDGDYWGTIGNELLGTTASLTEHRIMNKTMLVVEPDNYLFEPSCSIRVSQRNLTLLEYEYYQIRIKQADEDEMGSLFSPRPTALPTNITCSNPDKVVIGYVGCNMGVARCMIQLSSRRIVWMDNPDN